MPKKTSNRFSPEVRQRAVRMVGDVPVDVEEEAAALPALSR